jgi:N-methylhydantoinase B
MTIDLEGSSEQMEGPVNCGFAQTVSACRVAFKLLINPERPVDGGTFKTLEVTAPSGSIFDAKEPAACQWYFSSLGLLIDLVVTALAPVMPGKVAAAGAASTGCTTSSPSRTSTSGSSARSRPAGGCSAVATPSAPT